eukprot:293736-Alexandrium_andersonii.AAC.1
MQRDVIRRAGKQPPQPRAPSRRTMLEDLLSEPGRKDKTTPIYVKGDGDRFRRILDRYRHRARNQRRQHSWRARTRRHSPG